MSFLLDPPMLVASGVLIERLLPEEKRDLAEAATMGTFMGISFALYLEAPGMGMYWKPFRSKNGRDFMVNSGVFHVDTDSAGWGTDVAACAMYATYPFFLKLGRRIGRRASRATPLPASTSTGATEVAAAATRASS